MFYGFLLRLGTRIVELSLAATTHRKGKNLRYIKNLQNSLIHVTSQNQLLEKATRTPQNRKFPQAHSLTKTTKQCPSI